MSKSLIDKVRDKRLEAAAREQAIRIVLAAWYKVSERDDMVSIAASNKLCRIKRYLMEPNKG
jgi:hypothetical protein